jgi:integrase
LHDRLKADLWRHNKLNEKPERLWQEAVVKWLGVCKRKSIRSLEEVGFHLKWLEPYLKNKKLSEIDIELIDEVIKAKRNEKVSDSTINRMLEIIRAILNNSFKKGWVDKVIPISLFDEVERDRWLTKEEVERLLKELPPHLSDMAAFSLLTGLRKANVVGLKWRNVDLVKRHAFVAASQSKTKRAIPVPLSLEAIEIIRRQIGKHMEFVFTYQGEPVKQCNTAAWRKALKRAKIEDFHWHDLRHTWASWHIQNGTSLYELQKLGGWSSYETVQRYAHLNSQQLQDAAERVSGTKLVHGNI